ncbi:MAG: nucleoside-diphosphate kinase [Dehalococcoidales bacterium]|jgi:nucleoside-diphosphate kinase|nr:nucleoside-diphosphate kinase [Limnochordia bacterium]MDD2471557.1 nucleoside-diphosphate kinase [Dehalococcoidales bacterium]MDD4230395.1 nucleoside-diphosphate kinase [Dehalococcoidales bacterium]MDD4465618.1 nucleoside-diphosphate kinase [Dehalococcoidales bacterium]MDD5402100.1 nucleoside-diphosphate kinase [Dehalococcoidales bacterium]
MEKSLILVKPDGVERGLTGTILSRLEELGLKLVAIRMLHADKELAERHYAVHRDKPFFNDLVNYITSSPIVAAVFEGEDVVNRIRKACGATDPAKSEKGTIRGDFGLDIGRNTIHASDSPETAAIEVDTFFAGGDICQYTRMR